MHGPILQKRDKLSVSSDRDHLKIEDSSSGLLNRRMDVLADTKEIDMNQILRSINARTMVQPGEHVIEDSDAESIDREEETKESLPIEGRIGTGESLPNFYNDNRLNKNMLIRSDMHTPNADETSISESNVHSDA